MIVSKGLLFAFCLFVCAIARIHKSPYHLALVILFETKNKKAGLVYPSKLPILLYCIWTLTFFHTHDKNG